MCESFNSLLLVLRVIYLTLCPGAYLGGCACLVLRDILRGFKPNIHRRRRRDETVELRRVGVGGVYMNSQLAHDDCRRIR